MITKYGGLNEDNVWDFAWNKIHSRFILELCLIASICGYTFKQPSHRLDRLGWAKPEIVLIEIRVYLQKEK